MNKQEVKRLNVSWMIFLFAGLFLLSTGYSESYTGRYLTEFPDHDVCINDFDCNTPDVCCKLHNEDAGVCDLIHNCANIEEQSQDNIVGASVEGNSKTPQERINTFYIIAGTLLLGLSLLGFVYTAKQKKR